MQMIKNAKTLAGVHTHTHTHTDNTTKKERNKRHDKKTYI